MSRRKKTGIGLMGLGVFLALLLTMLLFFSISEQAIYRQLQREVTHMDNEMQHLIAKGLNHEELARTKTGLVVFMNDTLVFWNQNEVNPKVLKRRINLGNDTICSLLTGNYFVKSYASGQMSYYVYKRVSTSYPIENQYFEKEITGLPAFIDADIGFHGKAIGTALKNGKGHTLCYCKIEGKPKLKDGIARNSLLPIALLIVIGAVMAFTTKPRQEKPKTRKNPHIIEIGVTVIILIAIGITFVYYKAETRRENEQMAKQAQKLVEKRDRAFENSYTRFREQIESDTTVRDMLFAESNVLTDVILGYSKELLFDETMQQYTATLTLCTPEEEIAIQPEGYITDCDNYFNEKIAENKHERVGEGLYFMDYYTLDPNYLGIIKLNSSDTTGQKTLYYEFYKPIAPEGFGFPQMLQEANSQTPYKYSVASYRDNQIVYKYGRYVYPNFLSSMKTKDHDFSYGRQYKHYAIKEGEDNALIVSTPKKSWSEITAPFAIFFLGLLIPFLLIVWQTSSRYAHKLRNRSFRQRMQNIVLFTLFISFVAVAPVSVLYMRSLYNQKTMATQFETTRTLSIEMRNDLDIATLLRTASRDTWNDILQQYATTFFTDLNLYQLNGQLLATTRPELTELNLQAPLMNADAYQNIHRNKALFYTHQEQLGNGVYESSYIPLTDNNGNTLAYLNTPYFSSTTELHSEIKNFVLTYINIMLVILGIALVFILSLTKRLTQPLALIQNKLGDIKIDQKNEPIEWEGNDEIGALVKQYNQLIAELEKSAAELKRTTAESAWRGVARQVAHEIKNSLTPMRLSVQLLQRNMEQGKATPEQIQRTTNTLIEQIDALSDIASSFSTYAKLPENHPAPLDLAELVGNVVNLYDNAGNITFNYDYDASANHTFNGDKTNLNSAVGNLVKNAVQAIGTKPDGKIDVRLKSTETAFVISVKDNGKGIKEEDKSQIFLPNFTTKTGGSGVGLSLTYNIVQAAGGTISFESQEGEGAEFIIELPKN